MYKSSSTAVRPSGGENPAGKRKQNLIYAIARRPFAATTVTCLAVGLSACGGGGSSSAPPAVVVAPVVPVTPPATPPPPPPPPPAAAAYAIAQVSPGGTLSGNLVCAGGDFRYEATAGGGRKLVDVTRIGPADTRRSSIAILYRATDSFQTDVNGFGGVSFLPTDFKVEPAGSSWSASYFRKSPAQQYVDELEIHDGNGPFGGLVNVTFGRLSDGQSLCFFAVGSDRGPIAIAGTKEYAIVADGLALSAGSARRIYASTASARADWATGVITLTFDINGASPPFGAPVAGNVIGLATARLNFTPNGSINGTLSGPGGSTGTIAGRFFEYGSGAGLVFDLTSPNGDRMFGSLALDSSW